MRELTVEQLEQLGVAELIHLRDDTKISMAKIQGQLTQWNDDSLTGGFDEDWAARARGAMSWFQKELMMINAEIKRRAESGKNDLPSNKSQAFVIVAKELIPLETRKQIWTIAEQRYSYLFSK